MNIYIFWAYEWTFTFFWLNIPVWKWAFTLSGWRSPVWKWTFTFLPAHTQVQEWTFHPLVRQPTWLPCVKFDWKFRVIPLNWSWQHTCSRRMNIYIFPRQRDNEHLHLLLRSKFDWKFRANLLNWSWQQTYSRRMNIYTSPAHISGTKMNIYIFPAAPPVYNTWMDGRWADGASRPCISRLCTKMYIL